MFFKAILTFSENAGNIYLFFTPQFPPDGWENSQPEGTPTVCQTKNRKKEKKNKTRKTSNLRSCVEFPAISILFYHVALAE